MIQSRQWESAGTGRVWTPLACLSQAHLFPLPVSLLWRSRPPPPLPELHLQQQLLHQPPQYSNCYSCRTASAFSLHPVQSGFPHPRSTARVFRRWPWCKKYNCCCGGWVCLRALPCIRPPWPDEVCEVDPCRFQNLCVRCETGFRSSLGQQFQHCHLKLQWMTKSVD